MTALATAAARLGVLLTAALCAALLVAGCGTSGSGSTDNGATPPQTDASTVATPTGGSDGSGDKIAASIAATPVATVDRAEIERRLALPRFTYVGETDDQGDKGSNGALAFIDSESDTLAFRPRMGSALGRVAVSPDGRLVYVTDREEPVVRVVDAETHEMLRSIRLPGVKRTSLDKLNATSRYTYAQLQSCSSALACTPDGSLLLVLDKAGLQVIDRRRKRWCVRSQSFATATRSR